LCAAGLRLVSLPDSTLLARSGAVCSVDALASSAGVALLRAGGSAADAAVGASAVLTVTTQHMCGMGGDLVAVVDPGHGEPEALLAVGVAGAGSSAQSLLDDGYTRMPHRGDVRSVTVPGCVDGWLALHGRHGRLPLADVLAPATGYARDGFPISPLLAEALPRVAGVEGGEELVGALPAAAGDLRRRPRQAKALAEIAAHGREAWYGGAFGEGLMRVGAGLFSPADLDDDLAEWVAPLTVDAFGWQLSATPAPTSGYLALAGIAVADRLGLPADPTDPLWAHLLIEACRAVGHDRLEQLYDGAPLQELLDAAALDARAALVHPDRSLVGADVPGTPGGTIYLAAADADGMVVSLSQSNAGGFGTHLAVPEVGVFLQNRGIGFSLVPGHPAELAPGRRPPHTLAPVIATRQSGSGPRASIAVGTMGGDAQPQVVVQLLARLAAGATPAAAVTAGRWALAGPDGSGFDTWDGDPTGRSAAYPSLTGQLVRLEDSAPDDWADELRSRGHAVGVEPVSGGFGHASVLQRQADGTLPGAADPRAGTSAAVGY